MESEEYKRFQKFIYDDMIKMWHVNKLSYYITRHNLNIIMQKDQTVTYDRIIKDFQKYPIVKEVFKTNDNQIVVFPK